MSSPSEVNPFFIRLVTLSPYCMRVNLSLLSV
jgi:hypothetical protein